MSPRTWLPDPSHYPAQMTPLSATVWFEAVGRGLHEAMRELRGPFAGFEARTELGWAYEGELEVEWDPKAGGLERAALDLPGRWEHEMKPAIHEITDELNRLRPERPPPQAAAALLDRMWELVLDQWKLHFLAVVPAQTAVEMLHGRFVQAFGEEDPLAAYRLLDGTPNETNEADGQLWALAQRAAELGVDHVFREYPAELVPERLQETANGRRILHELGAYLLRFGGRARWHELSLPREAERPAMTIQSIRLFLEGGSAPRLAEQEDVVRLERQVREAAPEVWEIVPLARACYALKESHVYHIDYPGLLAAREVLLGFGRRLLAEGRLVSLDDVWMLRRQELRDAVPGDEGRPLLRLVEQRSSELARGLVEGPRPFLGEPPTEAERHPVLEKFYGRAGGRTARGLRGTGASPGVAEGPARLVHGAEDFRRVHPGDVLVATTTTPAWTPLFPSLAALVTETGGVLSHAAIVAREYGLPAVVGADGATRLIPDGARVRVDGREGIVELSASQPS